jgi:hypothetical protein
LLFFSSFTLSSSLFSLLSSSSSYKFKIELPTIPHGFAVIERGRVWVLQAKSGEEAKEWIFALDPSRVVEEELQMLRGEYDTLRGEQEQKDETISDLSSSLDKAVESV